MNSSSDLLFADAVLWSLFFYVLNWGWVITVGSAGIAIWYARKPHVGWRRGWQFLLVSILPIFVWFLFVCLGQVYFDVPATPLGQWILITIFIFCVFSGLFYSTVYFTLRAMAARSGKIN